MAQMLQSGANVAIAENVANGQNCCKCCKMLQNDANVSNDANVAK